MEFSRSAIVPELFSHSELNKYDKVLNLCSIFSILEVLNLSFSQSGRLGLPPSAIYQYPLDREIEHSDVLVSC